MGFLNDLDLDSVPADPNYFPDGKYPAEVVACKLQDTQAKGKFLVITYALAEGTVDGEGNDISGKRIDEWKNANSSDPVEKKAWLKQRIISLGVPESRVGEVDPEDLIGTQVTIGVKTKGEYRNVNFVQVREGEAGAMVGGVSDADL